MKRACHLALLALLLAGVVARAASADLPEVEPPVLITFVDGRVDIDREGRITAFVPGSEVPKVLEGRLDPLVKAIRFEPVAVDGRIVDATAKMRVTFAAREIEGGGMQLPVDNVSFPEDAAGAVDAPPMPVTVSITHRTPPRYPAEGLREGVSARVLAAVQFAPDGTVARIAPRQTSLLGVRADGALAAKMIAAFERATIAAIRRWQATVDVAPGATRTAEHMTGLIVIEYSIEDDARRLERAGRWVVETRSMRRPTPWVEEDPRAPLAGVSDLDATAGLSPRQSRYRLATNLSGEAL